MLSPAPQYRCATNLAPALRVCWRRDATFAGVDVVEEPEETSGFLARRDSLASGRYRSSRTHPHPVPAGAGDQRPAGTCSSRGASRSPISRSPGARPPTRWSPTSATFIFDADEGRSRFKRSSFPGWRPCSPIKIQILVVRTIDVVYNGVDFLEVLDNELPADSSYRQMLLLVHLFLPVPTTWPLEAARPVNISIAGGVRIPNVNVLWAISANDLIAGNTANIILAPDVGSTILPLVQPALPTDPDELGHILVIRTDVSGDYSPYELSIIDGSVEDVDGFNPPFFGFDSQLSRVTCSRSRSSARATSTAWSRTPASPPVVPQAPIIDYLAKDYASFKQLMLDRLSQTFPQWTERSEADIGITIVELLAYAADQLSYFQDTVSNEAYLGTARQRPSLRRHARLLDYTPSEGTNARTFVHIEIGAGRLASRRGRGSLRRHALGDRPASRRVWSCRRTRRSSA